VRGPPCLLTFPVSGLYMVGAMIAVSMNCFDTCGDPPVGWVELAGVGEGILAVTALVLLVTGVQSPARRRPIVAAAWAVCVLAYGIPPLAALGGN
jgi:hypothetical protein